MNVCQYLLVCKLILKLSKQSVLVIFQDGIDAGSLYECTFNDPLADMPTPMAILGEWVRLCGEPIRVIKMDTDTTIHEINIMLVARLFSCFLYTMSSRVIFIVLKCTYSRQDDSNIMVGMGDGTIRVHKKLAGQGLQIGPPYTLPAHSCGSVNGLISSHDTR